MKNPTSIMIRTATQEAFIALCHLESFHAHMESLTGSITSYIYLAVALENFAYAELNAAIAKDPNAFANVMAIQAIALVDWRMMADDNYHSFALMRLRELYAPKRLQKAA